MYITANIKDRNQIAELRCPALTDGDKPCPYLVTRTLMARIVDPETLKQLDVHDDALLVQTNPNATFCPGDDYTRGDGCTRIALMVGCDAKHVHRCVPVHAAVAFNLPPAPNLDSRTQYLVNQTGPRW